MEMVNKLGLKKPKHILYITDFNEAINYTPNNNWINEIKKAFSIESCRIVVLYYPNDKMLKYVTIRKTSVDDYFG
jgi:hypothetical protein